MMPEAERLFAKARDQSLPHVDPMVYQGLGFACLHQKKTQEAIAHFEQYARLVPADAKITTSLAHLKAGNTGQTVYVPGARAAQAEQPPKAWWRFW